MTIIHVQNVYIDIIYKIIHVLGVQQTNTLTEITINACNVISHVKDVNK